MQYFVVAAPVKIDKNIHCFSPRWATEFDIDSYINVCLRYSSIFHSESGT